MKPKKKTSLPSKKGTKKLSSAKPIMLFDKTIVTTKQKTSTTIEDHFQNGDPRLSFRTHKNMTPRTECKDKLEQHNMSPFSSNGGSSVSPKYTKVHSPRAKDQKDIKKSKGKHSPTVDKMPQKKKGETVKRQTRAVPKMTKEQQNQTAYEMLLMKRMSEKKITQMSQESSISIPKFTKLQLNLAQQAKSAPQNSNDFKIKQIKQLKQKIKQKYRKKNPYLKEAQLKFLCAVVLIQKIWRQHRTKNIISLYLSVRTDQNVSADSHREINISKMSLNTSTQQHTLQLIKKHHFLNASSQKQQSFQKQSNSTQIETAKKREISFNLKDLELSAQLTPQRQAKMVKFVQCLRDISYFKLQKKEKKSKINVFNLQQSLSEKCLMQKFYQKVFKDGQSKKNNFDLFNSKKDEKNLQRSIELIKSMKSPEKTEIIEIQQRLQTELQDQEPLQIQKVEVSVETQPFMLEQKQPTQINTLKQLSLVSQGVIFMLLNQFSQQFYSFTSRTVLRKKKKARLPGLKVNSFSIRQYLTGLAQYMMQNYDNQVVRRFCLVKPLSFLKIHHEYDDQDQEYIDEDDEQLNMPIVPNTLFYQYQLIYEKEFFKIAEEDKKYCNFLQGLIKIHNLLLANCMSEILEKTRIDRVVLPWDSRFEPERSCDKKKYGKKDFQAFLGKIIDEICHSAFMRVGEFHKRLDHPDEQRKILKSINQEYKTEGNDWSAQYEYLQLRIQLTKNIEQQLLNQIVNDLITFS